MYREYKFPQDSNIRSIILASTSPEQIQALHQRCGENASKVVASEKDAVIFLMGVFEKMPKRMEIYAHDYNILESINSALHGKALTKTSMYKDNGGRQNNVLAIAGGGSAPENEAADGSFKDINQVLKVLLDNQFINEAQAQEIYGLANPAGSK